MLQSVNIQTSYRSGSDDLAVDFYEPCLAASNAYYRAAGYFSSSIFLITGHEVLNFARRGGKIKLICSPALTLADLEQLEQSHADRDVVIDRRLEEELAAINADDMCSYPLQVLCTLIKCGVLEMRIGLKGRGAGIYHEKLGIFSDPTGNLVSFIGSANETFYAWSIEGNVESIETFCSWTGDGLARTKRHLSDFQDLWANRAPGVTVLSVPKAFSEGVLAVAHDDLDEIDMDRAIASLRAKRAKSKVKRRELLKHQSDAIKAWEKNAYRGVMKHATGSGKTFTALCVIKKCAADRIPSLVLVPSTLLLKQWNREIKEEMPDANILLVGGGNKLWEQPGILEAMLAGSSETEYSIVLSTMQTASTDGFLARAKKAKEILIVADEVHQTGSVKNSRVYEIPAARRLGLSATPERYGDPEGTLRLFGYFGKVVDPVVSLYDAIQANRLVNYEYYPLIVSLTEKENDEWAQISREIRREIAKTNSDSKALYLSDRAKLLLIQRSRIAKKATNKLDAACLVLAKHYVKRQHWLVYCEDINQLADLKRRLDNIGLDTLSYYSEMEGSASETLEAYRRFGGILLSIKCLDEGVDIPAISHAFILASSQNPRQFIQRRGRVLRFDGVKQVAVVYDAFVIPSSMDEDSGQTSLLRAELTRAYEFSRYAVNVDAGYELREIANRFGFDINQITDAGIEEELPSD